MSPRLRRARKRIFELQAARRAGVRRLAAFGPESVIVPPAKILNPHRIEIGAGVIVLEHVSFSVVEAYRGRRYEPSLRIGDGTVVGARTWVSCVGQIEIGSDVLIGHGVLIADSFHEYANRGTPILHQPMAPPRRVEIGAGAMVGPGAAILSGSTVGVGAYVVANAVVAGDVPEHAVVAGNPAELIRRYDPDAGIWIDSPDPRWSGVLATLARQG